MAIDMRKHEKRNVIYFANSAVVNGFLDLIRFYIISKEYGTVHIFRKYATASKLKMYVNSDANRLHTHQILVFSVSSKFMN